MFHFTNKMNFIPFKFNMLVLLLLLLLLYYFYFECTACFSGETCFSLVIDHPNLDPWFILSCPGECLWAFLFPFCQHFSCPDRCKNTLPLLSFACIQHADIFSISSQCHSSLIICASGSELPNISGSHPFKCPQRLGEISTKFFISRVHIMNSCIGTFVISGMLLTQQKKKLHHIQECIRGCRCFRWCNPIEYIITVNSIYVGSTSICKEVLSFL